MAILNFGSINIDLIYAVDHQPKPGETITSSDLTRGLGGKGANMSIAAAAVGADVRHIGAIGGDGLWTREHLARRGVNVDQVEVIDTPTGHAIIVVDQAGENVITLFAGANRALSGERVLSAIQAADRGDWLLVQNETAHVVEAVAAAKAAGLRVAYAAAPFDPVVTKALLPSLDLLAVNQIEAGQLEQATGIPVTDLPVGRIIVTRGGKGASLFTGTDEIREPAVETSVVDTTGAGDTFLGVFLGALSQGASDGDALKLASHVAAIQVSRASAAAAIPTIDEVNELTLTSKAP